MWYKLMRTQYGQLQCKKSGDGDKDLTEQDKWLLERMEFLKGHVYKIKRRQGVSLKAEMEAHWAQASPLTP